MKKIKVWKHPPKLGPCKWCGLMLYDYEEYHPHCLEQKLEALKDKKNRGVVDNLYE